ncbi:Protein of unknown function [Pyronema omphalodes CBS 100304]|uniref:Uncharacterized protein n=1 Tax=Pyronema omphalodes (strain CBS 100304) TaxID=1076935 RepID=U4L3M9_PYROM|nr:Protein of unknown function [Pyronema omphalodes CBS 100304]
MICTRPESGCMQISATLIMISSPTRWFSANTGPSAFPKLSLSPAWQTRPNLTVHGFDAKISP